MELDPISQEHSTSSLQVRSAPPLPYRLNILALGIGLGMQGGVGLKSGM